jgi:hypothetical protein
LADVGLSRLPGCTDGERLDLAGIGAGFGQLPGHLGDGALGFGLRGADIEAATVDAAPLAAVRLGQPRAADRSAFSAPAR